jgi:hypothetical protein
MKKLFALLLVSGFFTFTSCDSKKTSENQEVVDSDTTEVEVENTVVETDTTIESDTTTKTENVEVNK